jgi:hypothetical protein
MKWNGKYLTSSSHSQGKIPAFTYRVGENHVTPVSCAVSVTGLMAVVPGY